MMMGYCLRPTTIAKPPRKQMPSKASLSWSWFLQHGGPERDHASHENRCRRVGQPTSIGLRSSACLVCSYAQACSVARRRHPWGCDVFVECLSGAVAWWKTCFYLFGGIK